MATRCKICGQSNQDGVRFCGECGAQLVFDSDDMHSQTEQNYGHQNPGYQNQGYQNPGYQNPGYQNQGQVPPPGPGYNPGQGYQGQGYPGQGYQNYGPGANPGPGPGYQGGAYYGGPYQNGPNPGGQAYGPGYGYGGYGYGYGYQEWPVRSRIVAALLALFLGGFGAHKFYLGRTTQGVVYLVFSWTLIPSLISFFEGIGYLFTSDEMFSRKYMVRVIN